MYFTIRLMSRNHETIYWLVGGLKSRDEITSFNDYILMLLGTVTY